MSWTLAIAMLATLPEAIPGYLPSARENDAKISDQVNCAASFIDRRWKGQSIRQFQTFRRRIHEVIGASIGPGADDRFFVFGERSITTIFFIRTPECAKAVTALNRAKLFPKPGQVFTTSEARAQSKVVFQEI